MRAKIQRGADYERLDSDLRRQNEVGNMGVPLGDVGEKKFNWASELSICSCFRCCNNLCFLFAVQPEIQRNLAI